MAILDRLKKKPTRKKNESITERKEKKSDIPTSPAEEKIKREEISFGRKFSQAWKVLKTPQITEKATDLAKQNKYTFQVDPKTNKIEIKKVIEDLYKVNVLRIRILNVPAKKRRLGRISGWKKGYKKAIVTIKEGQKIEVLPR